jgi:carbamate kinase
MSFAAGSMGPKVEAACRFVTAQHGGSRARGRVACIGALADANRMLNGETGTRVMQ